ncbi:hypothetical protein MSZK_59090 [Mycobacterium sp. shizuoka-1]|nr:hypothetical protein MSZK_59090 [Mycobacterium sp. shizuoka-1]
MGVDMVTKACNTNAARKPQHTLGSRPPGGFVTARGTLSYRRAALPTTLHSRTAAATLP